MNERLEMEYIRIIKEREQEIIAKNLGIPPSPYQPVYLSEPASPEPDVKEKTLEELEDQRIINLLFFWSKVPEEEEIEAQMFDCLGS